MRWGEITEATMDKPWSKDVIGNIASNAQARFDALKKDFTLLGEINPSGGKYEVWGRVSNEDARFYVCDGETNIGYLTFNTAGLPNPAMQSVAMAFILPKYQRRGIAAALYRFALSKGVVIVSDATLTKGSRALWQGMIDDYRISVTLIDYDRWNRSETPKEVPLTNIRSAFSQKERRMVARFN